MALEVLCILLRNMVEENFRHAVKLEGYGAFFKDKLAFIVLLLAFLSFIYPLVKQWREHRARKRNPRQIRLHSRHRRIMEETDAP